MGTEIYRGKYHHGRKDKCQEKLFSHFEIKYSVIGTDRIPAHTTSMRLLRRKDMIMDPSELPNTFLMPISFVLDFAMNKVSPKRPKAAIRRVNKADMDKMVLRFFSEE